MSAWASSAAHDRILYFHVIVTMRRLWPWRGAASRCREIREQLLEEESRWVTVLQAGNEPCGGWGWGLNPEGILRSCISSSLSLEALSRRCVRWTIVFHSGLVMLREVRDALESMESVVVAGRVIRTTFRNYNQADSCGERVSWRQHITIRRSKWY